MSTSFDNLSLIYHDHEARYLKWHYKEPAIIHVTGYDDTIRAIEDGRLDGIMDEQIRYVKETDREIENL